jgi:exopolysaccharide biosynthesis polyprenyl glycosylphosphotransferase
MLIVAGIVAYYIRFAKLITDYRPVLFEANLPFSSYINIVFLVSFLWIIVFALAGLYNIRSSWKLVKEIYRVVLACSTGLMLIVILIFFRRELFDSRFIVLAAWVLSILFVSFGRIMVRWLQRSLLKVGIGVHKVILVGNSKTTDTLIHEFSSDKRYGCEIVKRLRDFSLDTANELEEFLKNKNADEIIQSDPNLTKAEVMRLFDFADEHHITFKYAADLLETKTLKTEVSEIAGIPIVEIKETPLDGWGRIAKRMIDILGSLFFIILFSPILIFAAIAVKLDSRGPIIYKNERVSKDGKFKVYKFRSFLTQYCVGEEYGDKEQALEYEKKLIEEKSVRVGEPLYKIADDPRVTRVGKFIRRWSIDELPQFFNVLFGSMSLVGPRPHQPREVAKYESHHKKVLSIKPGITGLPQISGRSDLSFEEEVKLDTYYIENWSLLFDLTILLRTPLAVIRGRKAE